MKKEIAKYFADRPEVVAVYLFGSHARSKGGPFSDVDIAVLLGTEDEDLANGKRIEYLTDLGRLTRKDIHPVIMNTAGEALLDQVFSTGICMQVNDEVALSRFKTAAFSKIAEFGYYRTQFQKGLIRKLKEVAQNDKTRSDSHKSRGGAKASPAR